MTGIADSNTCRSSAWVAIFLAVALLSLPSAVAAVSTARAVTVDVTRAIGACALVPLVGATQLALVPPAGWVFGVLGSVATAVWYATTTTVVWSTARVIPEFVDATAAHLDGVVGAVS